MTYLPARTLVLLCSVLILAGCSTFRPGLSGTAVEQPLGYRVGDIVDTQSGLTLKVDSLMEELSRAKVVYVGETHTSIEDHRIQLEILKRLYERNPSIVLAMEMFPTDAQPVLDRFSTGAVTEEEFLKEVKWSKIWGILSGFTARS